MTKEFTARRYGNIVKIYSVQDLWDAEGVHSVIKTPVLTEKELWLFNTQKITMELLVNHIAKVNSVSMEYPITLYNDGHVADGFHRILHANIRMLDTVSVRILIKDPDPVDTMSIEKFIRRAQA